MHLPTDMATAPATFTLGEPSRAVRAWELGVLLAACEGGGGAQIGRVALQLSGLVVELVEVDGEPWES